MRPRDECVAVIPGTGGPAEFGVAVVGAGAAGLLAALAARGAVGTDGRPREAPLAAPRVLLLDSMERPGRKILVSGGGRCNVTNASVSERDFVTSSNPVIARSVLREFPPEAIRTLLETLGVPLRVEPGGKVFPAEGYRARHVLDALLRAVREAGVETLFGHEVRTVERDERSSSFRIDTSILARRLVVATGGKSLPETGSRGFGLAVAARFGHTVVEPRPALVPMRCDPPFDLAGVTTPAILTVREHRGGKVRARVAGSLLFTHRGVSGPAALDASLHRGRLASQGLDPHVEADFWTLTEPNGPWASYRGHPKPPGVCLPEAPPPVSAGKIERFLVERSVGSTCSLGSLLEERFARRFVHALVPAASTPLAGLSRAMRHAAVQVLTSLDLRVRGDEGFRKAEATSGGALLEELDRKTLESRIVPGLHFCGEVVDVAGRLGGFNFQWAWASGAVAGRGASGA